MSNTYTIATFGDIVIAVVPDGGDIYAAVSDVAARADVDIDFRDLDVTHGVTLKYEYDEVGIESDAAPEAAGAPVVDQSKKRRNCVRISMRNFI